MEGISYIVDDQLGFMRGKGIRDAIAALRVLWERSLQHGKDLYVCFVDYEKAFDRVKWKKMMRMLKKYWSRLERQKPDYIVVFGTESFYKIKQRIIRLL